MKLNRLSKVAIGVAAACGIYSALGFWALPAGLKWAASGPVSDITGRKVSIGDITFNPWTLELSAKNIVMQGKAEGDPSQSIGSLYTNIAGLSSLTRFGLVLDALDIDRVSGSVSFDKNGVHSFQDVIDNINKRFPPKEEEKKSEPFRFSANNIRLTNSDFHILYPTHNVDEKLTDINLAVPFIGSIGSDREINVKPELSLKVNGSPFVAHGQTLPFKNTMATKLHADVEDYDMPHLGDMLPLDAKVSSGKLSAAVDLTFAQKTEDSEGTVLLNVKANAKNFAAAMTGPRAAGNSVAFDSLTVDTGDIDILGKRAEITSVAIAAPRVSAERLADGSIAWLGILPKGEEKKEAAPAPEGKDDAFDWVVRNLSVSKGNVTFVDQAAHNARIDVKNLNASLTNLTLKPGESTPFDLSAGVLDGSLKANGSLAIADNTGKASLTADKLNLARISGYLEDSGLSLEGIATAKANGNFKLSPAFALQTQGDLSVTGANLKKGGDAPLTAAASLIKADNFAFSLDDKISLKAGKLALQKPDVQLPKSDFHVNSGTIGAQSLALDWAGGEQSLAVGAKSLALDNLGIKAAAFHGTSANLTGTALSAKWSGKQNSASIAADLAAKTTELDAGKFKGNIRETGAKGFALGWDGDKQHLALDTKALDVRQTRIEASPLKAQTSRVAAQALNVSLSTKPGSETKVNAASVKTEELNMDVAGSFPVKVALQSLETAENALVVGPRIGFSSSKVAIVDIKSQLDAIGVDSTEATLTGMAFTQDAAQGFKAASADIKGLHALVPVNAAKVSTQTDTISASDIDWLSGTQGHARLAALATRNTLFSIEGSKTKFGRIDSVDVSKVNAPSTGTIEVESILIGKPRYAINKDAKGNLDIDPLLGKRKSAEAAKKTSEDMKKKVAAIEKKTGRSPGQPIRIGEFRISDGNFAFLDHTIKPVGEFRFGKLNATVKPVAVNGPNTPSSFSVSSLINGVSKLNLNGTGSPFVEKGRLAGKGTVTTISMPFFSPYTIHYVSYPIQKGNLTITADLEIKDRTFLNIKNHALLEKLTWGEYIPNSTSTNLPVKLATALLTDSKGNLEFDLPIAGDLASPDFSFSDLVLTGLKNLIINVVSAPVNLVGKLASFGAGPNQQAAVEIPYLSGAMRLEDSQKTMLEPVIKALQANPKTRLELTPVVSIESDEQALHTRSYNGLLRIAMNSLPEKERSRVAAVNALYAMQFPDDKASHTLEEKEAKLFTAVKPDISTMIAMGNARSKSLARALTDAGIDESRLFITAPEFDKKSLMGGVKIQLMK